VQELISKSDKEIELLTTDLNSLKSASSGSN
jgi:chromosome segregation ATPase